MIRHVALRNWKAFERLDLDLPEGTSFIVARNGVGKTSLLQALHFGLFGDRWLLSSGSDVQRAVRGGDSHVATVELTVELDGVSWVITRTVPDDLAPRTPVPAPSVTANDSPTTEDAWADALSRTAGVGFTELRLLAAIGEGATLSAAEESGLGKYNLVHHLSEVLGVSRLRESSKRLRKTARETSIAADNERLTLRDRPERTSLGEQERLAAEREPIPDRARQLEEQLARILERQRVRAAWSTWRDQERSVRDQARAVATTLRTVLLDHQEVVNELVGRRPDIAYVAADEPAGDAIERVARMQRDVRDLLDELRGQRDVKLRAVGGFEARLASIDNALQLLSQTTAICPTCRQPLSAEAAERARSEHIHERQELLAAEANARATATRADAAISALGMATGEPLLSPMTPPTEQLPDDSKDDDDAVASRLTEQLTEAQTRLRKIDASLRALQADAQQRAADALLSRRLVAQYRKADLALATADAFDRLAETICRERINPLSELLGKRWSELWPGRPSLTLDLGTGDVVGSVANAQISLADLSGGGRAVAIVLLRLLALQSASNSPILLMDEPLEHLDPRNRRLLASLLVAATRTPAPPRQVLVTTYEESVTRRLAQQVAGQGSHVVYVATRTDLSD